MAQWMQSVYRSRSGFVYSVGMNTPEGCLTIGNSSQGYASTALLAPVAVVGMLSAIAIPNFVKARATSQQNACINNLRQIDARQKSMGARKGQEGHRRADQGGFAPLPPPMAGLPRRRHLHHRRRRRTTHVQPGQPRPQIAVKNSSGNSTPLCGVRRHVAPNQSADMSAHCKTPKFARANSPLATRGRFG